MKKKNMNKCNNSNNHHSRDEIPYITISNSKSNSSNNQNSQASSKRILLTQTSNNLSSSIRDNNSHKESSFPLIRKKKLRNTNANRTVTFTEISLINKNEDFIPFRIEQKVNRALSEGRKEINIVKVLDIETPKKHLDKNFIEKEKLKNKKKAVLSIDNMNGKNLMDFFEKIYVNTNEDKNLKRISSVENIKKNTSKNTVCINRSWNKNNCSIVQVKRDKLIDKFYKDYTNKKDKNKSSKKDININKFINKFPLNNKKNIVKSLSNLFNININFEYLVNKYRPKYGNNNSNCQKYCTNKIKYDKNKNYTEKKPSLEKNKPTPKSDNSKHNCSIFYLKRMESVINLFHEKKGKQPEISNLNIDKRRLSAKLIKNNNLRKKQETIFNIIINNNISNKLNNKKIRDNSKEKKKSANPYFLKAKEKKDNEKKIQSNNKRFHYQNNLKK